MKKKKVKSKKMKNPNFSFYYGNIQVPILIIDSRFQVEYLNDAAENYRKSLEIDPEYGKAYAVRGEIKIYIDDYAGAIKDLNKAFEIDSEDADIYNNRGIAKKGCGDYAGAIQDLNKAFEIDPGNELIKNNLEYIKKEAIKNVWKKYRTKR